MKYYVLQFIKGIFIGSGAILPGISSGVFCVIFGIYEKLVNSVLNFFKDIRKNFSFLFPIAFGAFIGIVLFGNILKFLFYSYPMQIRFCIIGLIIGGIPCLIKQNTKKLNLTSIIIFLFTLFLSLYLIALENVSYNNSSNTTISYSFLIISGFLMSAGIVIPGISSTVILMLLGIYDIYLNAISTLNFAILMPIALGVFFGGVIFLKAIQILLRNFAQYTYYAICGFTIGSIFVLLPGFSFNFNGFISLILCIVCIYISHKILFITK